MTQPTKRAAVDDLRCLFVQQDGLAVSGVSTYGLTLWRELSECVLVLLNVDGSLPSELAANARVVALSPSDSHDPESLAGVLEGLLGPRRTVILPNNGDTPWSGVERLVRRLPPGTRSRLRVCGTVHGDHPAVYRMMQRFAPLVAEYVGVSRIISERLAAVVPERADAITTLPCPVPSRGHARTANETSRLRLLYAGRLEEPQKQVSRLPVLFERLAAAGVPFEVTIAGDGPAAATVARAVAVLVARHPSLDVRLVGAVPREEMAALYGRHDVLLLVSSYEGTPLVVGEAMAAGLCPAVMAIDSGLPELLQDGVNARVVPQGDIDALAAALTALDADRTLLRRLSHGAAETARTQLGIGPHVRALRAVLRRTFTRPAPDLSGLRPLDPTVGPLQRIRCGILAHADRPCVVVGAGMFGRKVVDLCRADGRAVAALLDSDPANHGRVYAGLVVQPTREVVQFADAVIVIGSIAFAEEIGGQVADLFERARIDAPPVVTTG